MRTSMWHAVLAVLAGAACSDSTTAPVTTWSTGLTVANEVPAPTGTGTATSTLGGRATVMVTGGGTAAGTIIYSLTLTGAPTSAITSAHIHAGADSAHGGGLTPAGTGFGVVRVVLCSSSAPVCPAGAGTVPSTTVTYPSGSTAVLGGTAGPPKTTMTFDGLAAAIKASNAYVNVHTTNNPGGEARGQLVPAAQ